jgi:FtsP/CotA-like multicopper oxidase with cupredoxin domain
MLSRRDFLKLSGAGMLSLYAASHGKFLPRAFAQIPGGTLDPAGIPKYDLPLVIPPAMPMQAKTKKVDFYKIAVRQFQQQILPTGYPKTTVWGYGAKKYPCTFNYPSFTIEASQNRPVQVEWMNELVDADGNYLPHLLPVDPTLHWANPPGGKAGRDTRPTFAAIPGSYTGPVPMISHVHGAVGVGDESDGHAEAWYLPTAKNIPAGYATEGTWYNYFKKKAFKSFGATWSRGGAVFQYPNKNRASTIWYHDHSLGMTRLNVYAGPAGFFLIRGGPDDVVLDSRGGTAVLPGPAPTVGSNPFGTFYEILIAIQDRLVQSGWFAVPSEYAESLTAPSPFIPNTAISPIWNPEFFGNTMAVNGRTCIPDVDSAVIASAS